VSKLDLSWNGFGYEGSLAVGELLRKNSTLTQLDLSSNRINWQGIQFIAKGLAKNRSLQTLNVGIVTRTITLSTGFSVPLVVGKQFDNSQISMRTLVSENQNPWAIV